jgi:hypothetical protein
MIKINLFNFQIQRGINLLGTEMCKGMIHTMTWDINGWKCDMTVQSPYQVCSDIDSSKLETAGFVKLARMAKMGDTEIKRLVYKCIKESENFKNYDDEMVGVHMTLREGRVMIGRDFK